MIYWAIFVAVVVCAFSCVPGWSVLSGTYKKELLILADLALCNWPAMQGDVSCHELHICHTHGVCRLHCPEAALRGACEDSCSQSKHCHYIPYCFLWSSTLFNTVCAARSASRATCFFSSRTEASHTRIHHIQSSVHESERSYLYIHNLCFHSWTTFDQKDFNEVFYR